MLRYACFALPLAVLAAVLPGAEISSKQYEVPEVCSACHRALYDQWNLAMHSQASKDPFYFGMFQLASRETKGAVDGFCSRCHTPVAALAGEIPPADHSKVSEVAEHGVFCDFCHTLKGHEAPGNARFIVAPGEVKLGPFADSQPMGHKAAMSVFHTEAEFCGTCHDVSHPINGLPLETTYTEWRQGPYNTDDPQVRAVCQDCHMTPGVGPTKPNPGKASEFGKERPNIFTHDAVGGGGVSALIGAEKTFQKATERLQGAAKLELALPADAAAGKPAKLGVTVRNVGCGHYLPTGLTEVRELWLEVVARTADGKAILESGLLDEAGEIKPGAVKYGTVVADAQGHPTPKFWLAASKVSDHRVPPKGSVAETYELAVPAGAHGPVTVEARLRYRAASPSVLRLGLGADSKQVLPIVDLCEAKGEFALQ